MNRDIKGIALAAHITGGIYVLSIILIFLFRASIVQLVTGKPIDTPQYIHFPSILLAQTAILISLNLTLMFAIKTHKKLSKNTAKAGLWFTGSVQLAFASIIPYWHFYTTLWIAKQGTAAYTSSSYLESISNHANIFFIASEILMIAAWAILYGRETQEKANNPPLYL